MIFTSMIEQRSKKNVIKSQWYNPYIKTLWKEKSPPEIEIEFC